MSVSGLGSMALILNLGIVYPTLQLATEAHGKNTGY
jgi:hypothetical protein